MILIGQYDSPFVRRVAIALHLYGLAYEHRPWSTFGDAEQIARYNPLRRVPTLVLNDAGQDGGEVLIESTAILDHLDSVAGPDRALIAPGGAARRHALKICALATGLCDKAVAMVYERIMHEDVSPAWVARCTAQIADVLDALEVQRSARATPFWFGARLGHADIAVACAIRFLWEAHPGQFDPQRWPVLAGHSLRCESQPPFEAVQQPFIPPAG